MSLRLRSLILAIIFSLGAVFPAEARVYRCDALFQPTVGDVLTEVSRDNLDFLFQGKSFEDYTQSLSWMRKRKVRKLLQEVEIRSFPTEKSLERHAIELSEALFGTSENFSRWMKMSADGRLEDSAILIIKEQLLTQGMLRTWNVVNSSQQLGLMRKVLAKIFDFQKSEVGQFLYIPWVLPKIEKSEISQELMYKIIRDGFNAHAEEARIALKQQHTIDAYNTFRRVYSPVVFVVTLIMQALAAQDQMKKALERQAQEAIEKLREQREYLEKTIPQIKQAEFEKAYAATIEEFKRVYGEPPTPEEAAILKAKIEKALKMN